MTDKRNFQVDLGGVITLLSDHLYSGPQTFVRELLQNGVDAVAARQALEPGHHGEITLDVIDGRDGQTPTIVFEDDGIGLTADEIHQFLATIGSSTKRGDLPIATDFIGQFGIGLLSCFVVSDQIEMITRSARDPEAPALRWCGNADGTYETTVIERDLSPGTRVYLRAKADAVEFFEREKLRRLVRYYGGLLPVPVFMQRADDRLQLNSGEMVWQRDPADPSTRAAILDFGREVFGLPFETAIPLEAPAGGLSGVAYVLPVTTGIRGRQTHRVYLKGMLLSEQADNLLPEWAFFVKCVVNATALRPTASRETFYEDEALGETREQLGRCIRDALVRMQEESPDELQALIDLHELPFKELAAEDDTFLAVIGDWLPFETTHGEMTLGQIRRDGRIRYSITVDDFRQVSAVAAAEGLNIVCGGRLFHNELLEKVPEIWRDVSVEAVRADDLMREFRALTGDEQARTAAFLDVAKETLAGYGCDAILRHFDPAELPALYSLSTDGHIARFFERTKEVANTHFAGLLDAVAGGSSHEHPATLCLNIDNPLVQRMAALGSSKRQSLGVGMLYVQAMLLGHQPLRMGEMKLLNTGLSELLELGLANGPDVGERSGDA